jgi:hypothetical protein
MDALLARLGALALPDSDGLGADVALLLDAAGAARGAQAPRPN